jgi:hypothetical protein
MKKVERSRHRREYVPKVRIDGGCYAMSPSWGAEPPEKESSRDWVYIGILNQ